MQHTTLDQQLVGKCVSVLNVFEYFPKYLLLDVGLKLLTFVMKEK